MINTFFLDNIKQEEDPIIQGKLRKKQTMLNLMFSDTNTKYSTLYNCTFLDNEENDLFANLDEEMDPNGLDDIVQQLEADSNDSESDDDDDDDDDNDVEAMSEDEQQGQSSEEEEDEDEDEDSEERIKKPASKPKFRDHYMGQITRAFGSDLDKIRQVKKNSQELTQEVEVNMERSH